MKINLRLTFSLYLAARACSCFAWASSCCRLKCDSFLVLRIRNNCSWSRSFSAEKFKIEDILFVFGFISRCCCTHAQHLCTAIHYLRDGNHLPDLFTYLPGQKLMTMTTIWLLTRYWIHMYINYIIFTMKKIYRYPVINQIIDLHKLILQQRY